MTATLRRISVVEDNPDNRLLLRALLSDRYQISEYDNGMAALNGLADSGAEIVLLDISPRIVDHVTQARSRAAKNIGYTLNLPLPTSTPWLPEVRTYWQTFGDRIGAPAPAAASRAMTELAEVRAVGATPSVVQRISILNLNVVTERLDGEAFDLVIATDRKSVV